jgi:GT2 family glycosyltransferase
VAQNQHESIHTHFTPAVSLAILTYQNSSELERCLASVVQLQINAAIEVIIVDNSGERCAYPVFLNFRDLATNSGNFKWVYVVSPENNIGRARRLAVETATAEQVAFLDSDCVVEPHWLKNLYEKLCALKYIDPQVAAVGGRNDQPHEKSEFYEMLSIMRTAFVGHMNSTQMMAKGDNNFVDHLSTCNVIYKRAALLKVGNFSIQFSRFGEDLEMSCRLRRHGFHLYFANDLPVIHFDKKNLTDWSCRAFRFGRAQAKLIHHGIWSHIINRRVILPLGLITLIGLEGLLFASGRPSGFLFGSYILATTSSMLGACYRQKKMALFYKVSVLLWVSHFAYAFGQLYEWIIGIKVNRGIS